MRALLLLAALTLTALPFTTQAQWEIQTQATTANLRGIDNVGGGIAWASGSNGTVLRTEDGGYLWQHCTTPPGAEHLDFRGIQAFDANTAIVMSSGKGDLSRLYKTTDGCQTWKLIFTNPDKDGFWDAFQMLPPVQISTYKPPISFGRLLGDPVDGKFVEFDSRDNGEHWQKMDGGQAGMPSANEGEAIFAASNSSLLFLSGSQETFVTGGTSGSRSRILWEYVKHDPAVSWKYIGGNIPLATGESAGAFSIATSYLSGITPEVPADNGVTMLYFPRNAVCVAVGGDYKKVDKSQGTGAFTVDGGQRWHAATTPPHGYRSAVAYDAPAKTWITVGPNGTDISTDDGRNWRALLPMPGEAPDAAQHWNALSLPFAVGPHGRIGSLNPAALKPQPKP